MPTWVFEMMESLPEDADVKGVISLVMKYLRGEGEGWRYNPNPSATYIAHKIIDSIKRTERYNENKK